MCAKSDPSEEREIKMSKEERREVERKMI